MVSLLDHVFADMEQVKEDRNLVVAYLNYLNEIISQGLPREKEVKYKGLREQLEVRLVDLDLNLAREVK